MTGGSDERAARDLSVSLSRFELVDEIARLRAEGAYVEGDRNALTLVKDGPFRLVLVVFRAGAEFNEGDQRGTIALQLIQGELSVRVGPEAVALRDSQIAAIGRGHPWSARALVDGAMLIQLAWPPQSGSVSGDGTPGPMSELA